jgi:hypothetical protein
MDGTSASQKRACTFLADQAINNSEGVTFKQIQ